MGANRKIRGRSRKTHRMPALQKLSFANRPKDTTSRSVHPHPLIWYSQFKRQIVDLLDHFILKVFCRTSPAVEDILFFYGYSPFARD
ncbi:MAG: hypothetical protein ACK55Z_21885, partial [bacterium]